MSDLFASNSSIPGMSLYEATEIYGNDVDRMQCQTCNQYFYESDLRHCNGSVNGSTVIYDVTCIYCLNKADGYNELREYILEGLPK